MPESDRLSTSATAAFWAKTGIRDSSTEENKESLSEDSRSFNICSIPVLWQPNSGIRGSRPVYRSDSANTLGLSMADTRALVCWLAATHDMGKATPDSHVNSANKKTVNILVFTANVLSKRSLTFPRDSYLPKKMHNALTASTARAFSLTYSLKML